MAEIGRITIDLEASGAAVGVAVARGCRRVAGGPALEAELVRAIDLAKARVPAALEDPIKVVRDLLRFGKYKPTGRGKPASEYLLAAAREDRFPRISALVDAANWISLAHLLPISLIDLSRAATDRFRVRRGRAGESYVFNAGGQVIDLEDLLLVAAGPDDRPIANPVKDSIGTKLADDASDVLAIIYAPPSLSAEAARSAEALAQALAEHGGAGEVAAGSVA